MKTEKILDIFKEIMKIPRESGHEEQIIAWLQNWAEKRNLECRTDEAGNVLIVREATKGCESYPTVVLQSHSDMVCEKNAGVEHDFSKDPIIAVEEDGWLIAKDTTLGADCGIGMAAQLAVLSRIMGDDVPPHLPVSYPGGGNDKEQHHCVNKGEASWKETAHKLYGHVIQSGGAHGGKPHGYELPLAGIFPGAAVQSKNLEHEQCAHGAGQSSDTQGTEETMDSHILNGEIHAQHDGKEGGKIYFLGWNNDFQLYDLDGGYLGKLQMPADGDFNIAQNYFLMDADTIWGHNKLRLSESAPSVFYIHGKTPQVTGIHSWASALLPMDEVVSLSNLLGGYVAHGGDLQMVELAGGRKYYTAINSPSLWRQGGSVRLKQAFNDTLYTVSDGGLMPYKVVNLGKWHWPENESFRVDGCKNRIYIDYVLENDRYFYFHFQTGLYTKTAKSYCAFYDKEKAAVSVASSDQLLERLHNQTLQIRNRATDGSFIALLTPDKLSAEAKEKLGVDEEDNPIVVVLK